MADENRKDDRNDGEGLGDSRNRGISPDRGADPPDPPVSQSPDRPLAHSQSLPVPTRRGHAEAPVLYGVMAEFDNPSKLVAAARASYEAGYRRINGYSPFPIEELWEAIGFHRTGLPLIVLIGGILGGLGGFLMQYYLAVIDYPLNVGGKPLNSWPAFIPITFECTILVAALSAVFGMLALNKLPQPYHPVFNAPNFALATRDSFFLVIEASDRNYNHDEVVSLLKSLDAGDVADVEV